MNKETQELFDLMVMELNKWGFNGLSSIITSYSADKSVKYIFKVELISEKQNE